MDREIQAIESGYSLQNYNQNIPVIRILFFLFFNLMYNT